MTPAIGAIILKFALLFAVLACIFWLLKVFRWRFTKNTQQKEVSKREPSMRALPSIVVGLIIFAIWMSIVGNPHVVETTIGVILALAGGIYFHMQILKKIWPSAK